MRYDKGTVVLTKEDETKEYVLEGITLTDRGLTGGKEGTWAQVKGDKIIIYKATLETNKGTLPKTIISVLDIGNVWEIKE